MIRPIRKAAATIGLIVVIALAGFSLSLAHESAPFGPGYNTGLRYSLPARASLLPDTYDPALGSLPKLDSSLTSWQRATKESSVYRASSSLSRGLLGFTAPKARKISLHLFDSILLI